MSTETLRTYGGVAGTERQAERRATLLETALDLLGGPDGADALTVRGVCREAGLATRYFYESFADRDELAGAVYDHIVTDIAEQTLTTLANNQDVPHEKAVRLGLHTIIDRVSDDPRRGRLLFSPALDALPVIADRRTESARMFVHLLSLQATNRFGREVDTAIETLATFLVGGLAQTLAAWLDGGLDIAKEELVELCATAFIAIGETQFAD